MFLGSSPQQDIYYEEQGQGVPLIFVPGWSMDHSVFSGQKHFFSPYYRVVLFDPPGCGRSARSPKYSFALMIEALERLIGKLELRDPHLVGWSLGGELLLQLVLKNKIRPRSLTLVCSTPCFVSRPDWPNGMLEAVAKRFAKGLKNNVAETMALFREETLYGEKKPELEKVLIEAGKNTDIKYTQDMFRELARVDLRQNLSKIRCPAYIVAGVRDRVCPPQAAECLIQELRAVRKDIFETGHVPFLAMDNLFNERLVAFLRLYDQ